MLTQRRIHHIKWVVNRIVSFYNKKCMEDTKMIKREIGKTIKKYREQKEMSQSELAKRMNTTRQCISSWEKDRTQPDIDTITRLVEIFDITLAEFFLGDTISQYSLGARIILANDYKIPFHKLNLNMNAINHMVEDRIRSRMVDKGDLDFYTQSIINYTADNELSEEEQHKINEVYTKLEEAVDQIEQDKFLKTHIVSSKGSSLKNDILLSNENNYDSPELFLEATPVPDPERMEKLKEIANMIKDLPADKLTDILKYAKFINEQ